MNRTALLLVWFGLGVAGLVALGVAYLASEEPPSMAPLDSDLRNVHRDDAYRLR